MDDVYRRIYAAIYDERTSAPDAPDLGLRGQSILDANVVRSAIASAESSEGRSLREDAKALLAVNFQELVLEPVRRAGRASDSELFDDVHADVATLTRNAQTEVGPAGAQEVSGHAIVDSLSRSWPELRITRLRLWEQAE